MRTVHHIEAPVETVFEFFKDPRLSADLAVGGVSEDVLEMKVTDEGTGTYYGWRARLGGLRMPVEGFEVLTDVVPNKHITEKSSSAMVGTWDYDFEPEGTGTKVTMEHHSRSLWGLPPLRTLTDLVQSRMTESFMQKARVRLETSSA